MECREVLEPAVSGFLSCFLFCGFSLPWRKAFLCPPYRGDIFGVCSLLGFPCGSAGKESACNVGDLSSIPGLGRSPGEGKGYPLQYSGLENFSPWVCKELDRTKLVEVMEFQLSCFKS